MKTDTPRTDADIMREAKILKLTKQNYHGLAKSKTAWYATMAKIRDMYEEGEAPQTDDQFRDAAKMVSDTPRTDAEWASTWQSERRLHELCQQLERELNASREAYIQSVERDDYLTQALTASQAEVDMLRHLLTEASYRINEPDFVREIEETLTQNNK